ncbi:MAG: ATP-binding protein [Clostridia bacterium]|nr:ATP-binding protein [Clostridia bacterium]
MGVKSLVSKVGGKAADKVAKLAVLSPQQLENIDKKRVAYLSEKPDPTDEAAQELTMRLIAASSVEVFNAYLPQLKELYTPVAREAEYGGKFNTAYNIRYFNITKWVTDKKENSIEKLINVYEVLSNENCNIALIFHRTCKKTEVFLAVTNTENAKDNVNVENYAVRLQEALKGNFPGSEFSSAKSKKIEFLKDEINYSVATASNIPAEKSEKFISQTIEKLLDGIVPDSPEKEYTIILLATPILDVEERKNRLSEIYSGLKPYVSWSTQFTYQETSTEGSSATVGINVGASAGVQNGTNSTITDTVGETDSTNTTETDSSSSSEGNTEGESASTSETSGESKTNTHQEGSSTSESDATSCGASMIANIGYSHTDGSGKSKSDSFAKTVIKNVTETTAKNTAKTITNQVGKSLANSLGHAVSKSVSTAQGISKATNLGANIGANFARSSNVMATIGKNESISQTFENYGIKHALELLENQMKRYEQSTAMGMWDFAAYIMSEDQNVASNVAHSYIALTEGEESFMSKSAINLWRGDMGEESNDAKEICNYLRELRQPLFGLNPVIAEADNTYYVYPSLVTATTALSGKELAYSLNFPNKSISGLPVFECAEFGRNISTFDDNANTKSFLLGKVFHMYHTENTDVNLSLQSLASHTFITGSTGSGKSNTVYQILNKAKENGVTFLVVEPAKGEYKDVFGNDRDVGVYGTNPAKTPLLKINPFSFPNDIHVLEHIDRLVEIFNVCWPMYAAMPAVLKNAVEKSYEDCGWNLITSENKYDRGYYPSFADVARNVKAIIDTSEYDAENKGAYKGSLLTRLQSLTNGIFGMIFTNDEIESADLFDKNVIADISRVGSVETKSLIMGMIVLKLQEYRMSSRNCLNAELKHITVLEEAHNILKRTSAEISSDSSNLTGKSVEMISNAIAEMRTYGEGFIIADQAPGLLDMAAIRNTNTKIIMRLPDLSDRELVGRAANLDDDQITELAKLPCGVGAVYQNEWIQPVLCKIEKYDSDVKHYEHSLVEKEKTATDYDSRLEIAEILSNGTKLDFEAQLIAKDKLNVFNLPSSICVSILKMLDKPAKEPRMTKLAPIMSALFPKVYEAVKESYSETNETVEWTRAAEQVLLDNINITMRDQVRRDIIQGIITQRVLNELNDSASLEKWSRTGRLV